MAATANDALVAEAGRRLAAAAPGSKVILFGSRARGEARSDSDMDLLVIEPELKSRRAEFVRLREALGDLGVPIDLIVLSAEYADERARVRGTMVNEAMRRGRVLVGARSEGGSGDSWWRRSLESFRAASPRWLR